MLRNVLSSTGGIQLVTIDIDTQINFTADEFWLSKTIGFDLSHDARNTTAPAFDEIHIGKRIGESFITNFRVSFFHALQGLPHWKFAWRSDFEAVIIESNLNVHE
mgnify:CR=1 FL=1